MTEHRVHLRASLRVMGGVFAFTGCAGLLAEQCFEKLLSNLVGASTPAAAVVLAVYFLGLSAGSAAYPRVVRGEVNPLRVWALLELGIAVWSCGLLVGANGLVAALTPLLKLGRDHLALLQGLRFAVACVWILPPTLLMGLTFPAVVDALEQQRVPQVRRAMARFYSLNLLGAVVGALGAPYLALPRWGLSGTLAVTAAIDGCAAALALGLSRRVRRRSPRRPLAAADRSAASGFEVKVVLALGFLSGFVGFSLEVLWTHLNAVVLGNSVYGFAAMLASVLIGLSLGGMLSTRLFSEGRPVETSRVGVIMMCASGLLLLQHLQWPAVPLSFLRWGGDIDSFWGGELFRWAQGARLVIPAATAMGMVYPALFRLEAFRGAGRARTVALLGALNSAGCVAGALATGFALIPLLSSELTSKVLGIAVAAMAMALIAAFVAGPARLLLLACGALLAVAWVSAKPWDRLVLTSGTNVYFSANQVFPTSQLLSFQEDTLGGMTTVVKNGATRVLLTNGKFQANDSGEVAAQAGFATVPVLFAPRLARALVIGLGSGYSAHVLKELGVGQLDIAEISPGIVDAAGRWFGQLNGDLLRQPGVHLDLEDGRNHLLLTDQTYDLISMELTSVWFAGATSLYSREFYQTAREHLAPDGILQQWVQLHHLGSDEVGCIIATLRDVFPFVELWVEGHQGVLVASGRPLVVRSSALRSWVERPPPIFSGDPRAKLGELMGGRLLGSADVDAIANSGRFVINTDANRFLEYATPRYALEPIPPSKDVRRLWLHRPAELEFDDAAEGQAWIPLAREIGPPEGAFLPEALGAGPDGGG